MHGSVSQCVTYFYHDQPIAGLATRSLFVRCSFVPYRSYSPLQLYSSVEEHPEAVEGKIHGIKPLAHLFNLLTFCMCIV